MVSTTPQNCLLPAGDDLWLLDSQPRAEEAAPCSWGSIYMYTYIYICRSFKLPAGTVYLLSYKRRVLPNVSGSLTLSLSLCLSIWPLSILLSLFMFFRISLSLSPSLPPPLSLLLSLFFPLAFYLLLSPSLSLSPSPSLALSLSLSLFLFLFLWLSDAASPDLGPRSQFNLASLQIMLVFLYVPASRMYTSTLCSLFGPCEVR